ncbi:PP2C family protein-serine/threonine phosphatase [Streptomyces radicis]|uniref:Serine/threonine-protein phosphatase n=1 Tax=Streptomyces radicis TaxID=1750517 RepID=A0A3A9WFW5_9ACTN|nr:PP2C family protein-serine/threonine phosphatase [Streptomyces radicis]RKN11938.1 serine/threonine-protein phosphatase [Streptomyces radicis]RKN26011.1 serine/threonine-protein phosphatase [Streptomyces radicis]
MSGEPGLRVGRLNLALLLPTGLLVTIAAVDTQTSGDLRIVTWIVLVPGIAAALCGVVATALFAAGAAALFAILDQAHEYRYHRGAVDFWLVVAGGLLAVLAAWLRRRARDLLVRVENAADATRLAVLRPIPRGAGGLESASVYLAADSAARVGGDFFDIQPSPHGTRVLLGDVQGKGTSAVDAAAALLSAFREAAYYERDLASVAWRLETRMRRHNYYIAALGQPDARFTTAVLVSFPPADTGWIELVNFGHPGPLALGGTERVRPLPEGEGAPLGMVDLVARVEGRRWAGWPPTRRVPFGRGETLLLFSDGVTEARDRSGAFLPLTDRLEEDDDTAPDTVVDRVSRAVLDHTRRRLADDTAILAVRRTPPEKEGEEKREGRGSVTAYAFPEPPPGVPSRLGC